MKLNRLSVVILAAVVCGLTSCTQKQTGVVWNNPTTEAGNVYGDGFFISVVDVTKVEMKENETVLYMNVQQRSDNPGYKFRFDKASYLLVDGERYPAVSADGIKLGKWAQTNPDGQIDIAIHFEPVPLDTKSIDFIEGDSKKAYFIKGIKPVEERWKQLFPSYWRNDKTGDWEIALLDSFAIYQCKFWNYKSCDVNKETGETIIVMDNDGNELTVKVDKNNKGKRAITVGGQKTSCSMITGRFLPDYPRKDTRKDFAFNDYKVDTVTVIGWLKDIPDSYRKDMGFSFTYQDMFVDEKTTFYDLDEQGRFTARIPVYGSTEFFCDWGRCYFRTMLEPGKTYFMLYDFKEGRRFFMGDDVRLQNELFKYPLGWKSVIMSVSDYQLRDYEKFIVSSDSLLKSQNEYIDSLCAAHPKLSTRFRIYRKDNTLWLQARRLVEASPYVPRYRLPEIVVKYAYETFWTKIKDPITLHRDTRTFLDGFLQTSKPSLDINEILKMTSDEEDLSVLKQFTELYRKELLSKAGEFSSPDDNKELIREFMSNHQELYIKAMQICARPENEKWMNRLALVNDMKHGSEQLDSLGTTQEIKDMVICGMVKKYLKSYHCSVEQDIIDTLKATVSKQSFIEDVEKLNNYYIALENNEFDKLVIKSSDNLKSITEGEALLKEILKPLKGKFVLLDVWGTWCSPCREALRGSAEEYERLKPYNVEFLYLANKSPQDTWENIIKEFNVSGKNVSHYNLPARQQAAIERYLDIHAYPSYKLFDREGNLLDIMVDARELEQLEDLLKRLSAK